MVNLVIAYSQQRQNKCKEGDTEHDHMYAIAKVLYDILRQDKRFNIYLIPPQNTGTDIGNLKASIKLSNDFIAQNGGEGYHLELHSDAGGYAKGASGLYVSEKGKAFITPIIAELMDLTPTTDVGLVKRTNLAALNETKAVAGIIEVSFHDDPNEAKWIHEESISIAVRLANGIYKSLTKELNTSYAYEIIGSTTVIKLNPMDLKAKLVNTKSADIACNNFINSNFFSGLNTIGWLISEGKILSRRDEYKTWKGNPKGTLIVYRDGSVFTGLKWDSDIVRELDKIWFCCQGFNLSPLNLKFEGFGEDVGRASNRPVIGYDGKNIVIAVRPNTDAQRAAQTLANLNCKGISLDAGGSTNLKINGKYLYQTDRELTNIITW